jgi:hypothetical protein
MKTKMIPSPITLEIICSREELADLLKGVGVVTREHLKDEPRKEQIFSLLENFHTDVKNQMEVG